MRKKRPVAVKASAVIKVKRLRGPSGGVERVSKLVKDLEIKEDTSVLKVTAGRQVKGLYHLRDG